MIKAEPACSLGRRLREQDFEILDTFQRGSWSEGKSARTGREMPFPLTIRLLSLASLQHKWLVTS